MAGGEGREKMQELEKKALEFNMLEARFRELEQNLAMLEKQISELQACILNIDEFKNSKKGTEMLMPLSPGVFTKGKLEGEKELLVDVGSKILCKKTAEEAKKIIQGKVEQAMDVHQKLAIEMNNLGESMNRLGQEITEMQRG